MVERYKMRYFTILITLFIFLFVTNSATPTQDRFNEHLPELYKLLKKGDAVEKQVALQMLWFLDKPKYHKDKFINPILKLLNDKNPKVREAAAAKFKRPSNDFGKYFYKSDIAKKSVVPALIRALSDRAAPVRIEAAKALCYYHDQRAVGPLISLLQDQEVWVRFEAIRALGKIKAGVDAVIPLMNVIAVGDVWPTQLLQKEAIKTLALITKPKIKTVYNRPYIKKRIHQNINWLNKNISKVIVRKTSIDPIIRGKLISILLKNIDDPYLRIDVVNLLGSLHISIADVKTEKIIKSLIASAGDKDVQIRKRVLSAMYSIVYQCAQENDKADLTTIIQRYRSMVTGLCIKMLKDSTAGVRKTAADILGKTGDSIGIEPLISALNDDNPDVKATVVESLGKHYDSRVIQPLLAILTDQSETVRINAIGVLSYYNDLNIVKALPPYFGTLKTSSGKYSVSSNFLIVARATKQGQKLVYHYKGKKYIHDIDLITPVILPHDVDRKAVKVLLYHPVAVESIIQTLKDPNFKGHFKALTTLKFFEDERIAKNIMPFLDNPSPAIRKAALYLVYLANDPDRAKPIIKEALKDKDIKVQKEARKILNLLEPSYDILQNIEALKSRDSGTRLTAVKALTWARDKQAVASLINALDDTDYKVRLNVVRALNRLNDKRAVEPLIRRLDEPDSQVRLAVVYALKSLRDDRAIEPLLALTDDKHIKMAAVSALSWFDDPRVKDFYLGLLQNENEKLKLLAVNFFIKHPDKRAVEDLILLLKSTHKLIPVQAAEALGESKDKRAVKPLIELLTLKPPRDDKKAKTRICWLKKNACSALGNIGDKRAFPLLVKALKDDQLNKSSVISALGKLQDKRAVPFLLNHLSDPSTKRSAIKSLGEIGDSSLFDTLVPFVYDSSGTDCIIAIHAVHRLDPKKAQNIVIEMLNTKKPIMCCMIMDLLDCLKDVNILSELVNLSILRKELSTDIGKRLNKCNDPEITAILISFLTADNDRNFRIGVIDILGEFDAPEVKTLLNKYSHDSDPVIRRHANAALEETKNVLIARLNKGGVKCTSGLSKNNKYIFPCSMRWQSGVFTLEGNYRRVGVAGYQQIYGGGNRQINNYVNEGHTYVQLMFKKPVEVKKLISKLNHAIPGIRQQAAEYLGYFGNTAITSRIIPLLKDKKPSVRLSASRALGLLEDTSALSHLADTLYDPDMNVKCMAIWALGNINDAKAVRPISILLGKQQKYRIKENCFKALTKIGNKAARNVLVSSFKDNEDYRVRMLAVDAINRLDDAKLAPLLVLSLKDNNEYVRQAAVRSIGRLEGKYEVSSITDLLSDNDFNVRKTAIETLGMTVDLQFIGPLTMLLLDDDKEIQKKADTVLRKYIQDDDAKYKIGDIFLESVNTDNSKSLRKSEMLLKILGKDYAIIRLSDPDGDETKTILRYIDLLSLRYRSNDFSKLGKKALNEFKDRKLVIETLTSFILNRSGEKRNRKRREAVYFLESLKDPTSAPLFIHILENAPSFDLEEKRCACRYLGHIGHKKSAPLLRRRLSDSNEDYTVRMDAAEALGRIGDRKSVDLLIKTMGSAGENPSLRQAAIRALGSIGEKHAVIPLIEVLRQTSADYRLRAAAATSLGKIKDKRAIPVLEEAMKSIGNSQNDKFIKRAIKDALKKFKAQ